MNRPLFTAFCRGLAVWLHPRLRSVFVAQATIGLRAAEAVLAQKPPSSLTRKRVHRRTGFRLKGQRCPLRNTDGLNELNNSSGTAGDDGLRA